MKYIIILLVFGSSLLFSQDTSFVNISGDTIFYQWEILEDQPLVPELKYNNGVFLSSLHNAYTSESAISRDNFKTWHTIPWFRLEDDIRLRDYDLLPNGNIVMSGHYREKPSGGAVVGRAIMKLDDIEGEWKTYMKDEFKDIPVGSIKFKDSINGILAVGRKCGLYRTTNGGTEWFEINPILVTDKYENYDISDFKYFKDSELLMGLIFVSDNRQYYFTFSKDFGETWSELRNLPRWYQHSTFHPLNWGFFTRNDSLWFAGGSGTGHGSSEHTEYIYFSSDLGKTWEAQYLAVSPVLGSAFTSVEFFDNSLVGVAAERSARVLITFDGGNNWTWIRDSVSANGDLSLYDYFDPNKLGKYRVLKADNKMIFSGLNKLFIFNNLNIPNPTSVKEGEQELALDAYYDIKSQNINILSKTEGIIQSVRLYDLTGKTLYSGSGYNSANCTIPKSELNNAKNVFAIIQANNQMYFKQLMCE